MHLDIVSGINLEESSHWFSFLMTLGVQREQACYHLNAHCLFPDLPPGLSPGLLPVLWDSLQGCGTPSCAWGRLPCFTHDARHTVVNTRLDLFCKGAFSPLQEAGHFWGSWASSLGLVLIHFPPLALTSLRILAGRHRFISIYRPTVLKFLYTFYIYQLLFYKIGLKLNSFPSVIKY